METSLSELTKICGDKECLYKVTLRNGYFLNPLKCKINTMDYLLKVRKKKIFCPLTVNIKLANCADPPPKKEILKALLIKLD